MYKIDVTSFGYYITFDGTITESDIDRFNVEVDKYRPHMKPPFHGIIDVRKLVPPEPKVINMMHEMMLTSKKNGLQRMAIIGNSPIIKNQVVQLAFRSEMEEIVRYFNASRVPDWDKQSRDWILYGIEPELDTSTGPGKIYIT